MRKAPFLISLSFSKINRANPHAARNRVEGSVRRTQSFLGVGFDNCMAMKMVFEKWDRDIMIKSSSFVLGLLSPGISGFADPAGPG